MNLPTTSDIKEMKSVPNSEEAFVLVFISEQRLINVFEAFKDNPSAVNFTHLEDVMLAYQNAYIIKMKTR